MNLNIFELLENFINSEVKYQARPNENIDPKTEKQLSSLYNSFKEALGYLNKEEIEELINMIKYKINNLESRANEQSIKLQLEFYKYFCQVELEPKLKGSKRI